MMEKNSVETGLEIAVIGMAGKFPGAKNLEEFWENLKNGVESLSFFSTEELKECGISEVLLKNPDYVKAYGVIAGREYFDASFFGYSPKEAETLDPLIRLLHECSWEALEDAGYDPMSYQGSIGMYAGASDGLGWQVALRLRCMMDKSEDVTGHMTDCTLLLSSRLSHKLNLRGPSITMFTACSTGLVVIHTACRALLTGECEMALAGAGSVLSAGKTGYLYQEGMIMSPDGHCRAFDEKAKGTLYGEGAGVVLLKRLKDARADGDTIKCIIKASAVNNDGIGKASFTAPGKKRIADVIRAVLKLSRVEPEAVGYIEAHGTATALGDAIEIEALKEAFTTGKKGFCGIGSVKSNFGHLDVAAGIAGFIKTVLSLMHRLILPSLHFENPNPKMDFIDSPFYVNNMLSPWENRTETGGSPLRAGVCSFGVGGTNAFVLVEEAVPGLPAAAQSKMPQLLVLSARTESALEKVTGNLVDYLKNNPGINLADVAYTLQVGRRAFSRRRMLVCSDSDEAVEALSSPGDGRVQTSVVKGKARGLTDNPAGEGAEKLKKIGMAWLNGANVDWQEFQAKFLNDSHGKRSRIPLPTYPFERERYWFDVDLRLFSTPDSRVQRERVNNRVEMEPEESPAGLYQRPPLSTEYAAPSNEVEQALVGVWQKFFGIREVGIFDDFFELGGDSLKAITVVTEIHKTMETRVPVTEIFQSPTIKKLAEYIKGAEPHEYSEIAPVEQREYYPLSSVQRRLYILQQIAMDNTGYNDTLIFEVESQLDKNRLENVFIQLVARHESLRTSFELIGEETFQRIHPGIEFIVDYYDLSGEANTDVSTKEKQVIQEFVRSFDLSRAPLLRVGVIRRSEEKHILMTDMHHIITDGSSIGILMREFITLYTDGSLSPLRIQYKDYTQWQNSDKQKGALEKQELFWLKVFEDEVPVLNLPTDYLRPAVQSFAGNTKCFVIDREETGALKKAALKLDVTLFMMLFSVCNVMLAKICGQEDIVVGTPVAARTHADLQHLIGMLVNTLALRNFPAGEKTFAEFLKEVRENTLAAFENQDYLFEDLVEQLTAKARLDRDTGRNPVFDVMFNLLNIRSQYEANLEIKSPGLSLKPYRHEKGASIFDMLFQGTEEHYGLYFTVEFCTRLFKPETIDRFIGYFKRIISRVCEDVEIFISDIEILSPGEKEQLLVDFNRTEMAYPREKTIYQLFEEQAARTPDNAAVVGAQGTVPVPMVHVSITYKELNKKTGQLAQALIERGIGPDIIVGIMAEDSLAVIIGMLGILKAGGAFLPIDPDYPRERIDYMLKDSNAALLLTAHELLDVCRGTACRASRYKGTACCAPTNLAYIIYTSGSTGRPKGVLIRHGSITNQLYGLTGIYSFAPSLRHILMAPFTFDPSVQQVFLPLVTGGTLFTVAASTKTNPDELLAYITANHIELLNTVPTLMEMLVENVGEYKGLRLKYLILAGEIFPSRLHRRLTEKLEAEVIINIYGPTEATINTTLYRCQPEESGTSVPIGSPLPNYKVYIVNKDMQIQPVGVSGEILIGGEGLAGGYLNNPDLTAEKFLYISKKIYKTGDLARWLADGSGNIEFLGRIDQQVKIRGHRVELGEIESGLMALPGIKEAVVTVRSGKEDETYLCAYVVPGNESGINISFLRQGLSSRLPGYMIPSYFVEIKQIPLTSSNKVDRRALPEPGTYRPQLEGDFMESATGMEKLIAEIWQEVLNLDRIGINDNFFELGGNSVSLVKVIVKLRKILKREIPTERMFQYPTVYLLARYITEQEQTESAAAEKKGHLDKAGKGLETLKVVREKMKYMAVEPVEMKDYYPLSSAQKRLYFLQQMVIESSAYNMPFVLPLGKDIEKDRLQSVLKQLIDRHDILRTSFIRVNDEPVQKVHKAGEIDFANEYYEIEGGIEKIIEGFVRPFDLSRAPLIRSGIVKCAEGNLIWMVDVHHIVSDGTSHTILTEDFFCLYNGGRLESLKLQYKDFSHWQNRLYESGAIKAQEDYWLGLYPDIKEIPRLNVAGDYKRPEVFTFAGAHYGFALAGDDVVKFRALSVRDGGTFYMNILAALNALFYKYTGQTDIIIGSGIAGRSHDDFQDIIGMFVNMLAMRNYPAGEKTYRIFLKEVIHHSIQAFENQDVQFEELVGRLDVERDPSRNPLFDISLVVQNYRQLGVREKDSKISEPFGQVEQLPAVQVDENLPHVVYNNKTSKFDLTFFIFEIGEDVHLTIEYYKGIFKEETIQRLAAHFKNVIKAVIKNPSIKLKDIEIIPEEEKQQVLYKFNDTAGEFPAAKTVHQLFAEQVERAPDSVAVVGAQGTVPVPMDHVSITYKELNEKSNQVARYLWGGKGIKPGDRVGIWMSQSLYRIIGILGILKAGGAYVPIDPSLPEERIKYMIDDSSIGVVISEKKFLKGLNRLQWECRGFHSYLCVDSFDIHGEDEIEPNELMDKELWHHVGETAGDDITGGGWINSYTGEPLTGKEMDEYGDNILKKLAPLLHPRMRVLEIGCGSGISMYRLAPDVGLYYGTDLSAVMIDKNRKGVEEEGHRNIKLSCLAAHEIDKLEERDFDLVIMNSVIQCFHGHNYLRKVIGRAVEMLGEKGYLFIGDIMDQEKKAALVRELTVFKQDNRGKSYTTKTDFSSELFVSRGFWSDLAAEWQEIEHVECTEKIYTIENELTRFRYDTLISINKTSPVDKKWVRFKHQDDLRNLPVYGSEVRQLEQSSESLAYVIYTSGTTGQPKGVMIEHRSLVNLCYWHNRYHQISEADNTTLYAGFGFDASVLEIFPHLLRGAALHLVDDAIKLDIEALNAYFERNHISVSYLPTQFCEQFMNYRNRSLRVLLTGGDKLRTFVKRSYYLFDNYGPTENTVVTTGYRIEKSFDNIPIGKPVDNTRIYILDREGWQPQPVGVAGELCISGMGLFRGYLNSPELTAEKFLSFSYRSYRSYRSYISEKIYKTGDLARWLVDGNIEFLGRIDYQVKIRGYRIELADIESQLLAAEGVKDAVVTARKEENGEKYLCAYIVSNQSQALDTTELRGELSARLPEYMVPAYFMQLDGIPLTPNGKVDRKRLPGPDIVTKEGYAAPRNAVEEKLVEIWADLLSIERESIGIETNFFYLGGHSLKATILTARIHKELDVKIPLAQIFTTPTIKGLSEFIRRTGKERHISIEPAEEKEYYPLSSAQKRLYVLHQLAADSIYYNIPSLIEPEGIIDREKVELVFKKLIARHESLKTSFETVNEEPVQKAHREVDFSLDHYEVNEANAEDIIPGFTRPFDLSKAPLLRVNLITVGASRQVLFMDMHHIITDGTSQEILEKEFAAIYSGQEKELPLLKLQYKDYSQWMNSKKQVELRKQQEVYWLKEFSGELPVLNLPTDYPRPFLQGSEGNWVDFPLSARETKILKDIAGENEVTLYMILLAVFNVLFSKLSGQEDIVLGTPIAARRHTDLQQVIGMMVNTLPMRNHPSADKPFNRFLKEVKQRTVDAYENQEYPFEELVEHIPLARDTSRNPLFDIMLNVLNQWEYPGEIPEPDDRLPYRHRKMTSRFDMLINAIDLEERIYFSLEYSTRLFTPGTIERFIGYLKNIILYLPGNTERKLLDIEYIPGEEKEAVLEFCTGMKEIPGTVLSVHRLFEERAGEVPDRTALVFEDQHLGYGELNEKSGQVARTLKEKGVLADDIVGIMLERSLEMIIGILGILKAGGAYLPIDPEYPRERIDYMLKDSGAKILLTGLSEGHLIHHSSNRFIMNHSGKLVYIIYTSGSTGRPKGVLLEHRNLVNLILFQYRHTDIDFSFVLQFTTISFDVSAQEIFSTLLAGGRLILTGKETLKDIPELFGLMTKEYIKTLFAPASFLKFVMSEEEYVDLVPGSLKHIVTAGEQVIVNEGFREYLRENSVYLHNHYGPSETHVVTALTLDPDGEIPELPSIGRPVSNTIIYILDKGLHLVPQGVAGELVIGGMQVGRGYLNQPELTAERFVLVSYKSYRSYRTYISSKIIYRTGDLARWLVDGNIEFLGRIDYQVKIRGFRVELGEIESRLLNHDQIKECVVAAGKDEKGGGYLCAYIVGQPHEELEISQLRDYLAVNLPDYMIPAFFVFLEQLPLNPSGKVDRQALPVPELKAGKEYIAPGNAVEERLAEIWSEVLGIEKDIIGIDTDFFSLGGHSLKATILSAKIHKELDVKIPLAEIFKNPHIRGLGEYLKGTGKEKYAAIAAVEAREYYALSSAQKRLYVLQQVELESMVYNMPQPLWLSNDFDAERVGEIFLRLLERHESLRTSFSMINEEPVQRVHDMDEVEFSIDYYDIREDQTTGIMKSFVRPFDLSRAPLLRVGVIRVGAVSRLLLIDMHHIITDGISQKVLEREFAALNTGEELPPLRLQYKDFSQWQNNKRQQELIKHQEAYWINLFSEDIPVLNLPVDYPRPPVQVFKGDSLNFVLTREESLALKNMANACNGTLYMPILAVWTILLSRLSGQEDIVVGTPIAARRHADLEKIIGMFVNTLALRNYPLAAKSFREFLVELKERTLAAYENQEYPFEELVDKVGVKRDASRSPIFDVMFALQNFTEINKESFQGSKEGSAPITDSKQEANEYEYRIAKFDMTLTAADGGEHLYFDWEYCTRLFKKETLMGFIRYFKKIISVVGKEPGIKIGQIDIIPEEETKQILYEFNAAAAEYPRDKTIHRLFEEQAAGTPDKIALCCMPHAVTYRELNRKSDQLANYLRNLGVKGNEPVGLLAERSPGMIVGILGILKAGCGYVPLNPKAPAARTKYMLDECSVRFLVSELSEMIEGIEMVDINAISPDETFSTSQPLNFSTSQPSGLAYTIYTSGSTGRPKGVAVTHSNLCPLLHWGYKHLGIGADDRIIQNVSYYFDWSVWEIFITLTSGASLYIVPEEILLNAEECIAFMNENEITALHVTPTQYGYYVNVNRKLETLKYLFLGAEKLTYDLLTRSFALVTPGCRIFNMYGPTETAVISSALEIDRWAYEKFESLSNIPIGRPAANATLLVLDRSFNLCPVNITGELYIGGGGAAPGYLNQPELTAERFITISYKSYRTYRTYRTYISQKIYKTGDLARWLADGNLEFLGRIDHQVKVRGFRIELGEIENHLLKHQAVSDAVVITRENERSEKYLCAYIAAGKEYDKEDLSSQLKQFLSQGLPDYMIPSYFVRINKMPLNPNGKVDRKALPEPVTAGERRDGAPGNNTEKQLVEIWWEVLGIGMRPGIDDNFFELGGHSLKATILLSRIYKELSIKMPLAEVFKTPTIRGMARYIAAGIKDRYAAIPVVETKEYYTLSSAQKRLYILQQMQLSGTAYNMPQIIPLSDEFDVGKMEMVFIRLLGRHQSLRTSFLLIDEEPVQKVHDVDEVEFSIEYYDCGNDDEQNAEIIGNFVRVFDLSQAPLLRVGVIKTGADPCLLLIDMHHIISDGISQEILKKEFASLYAGEELLSLRLQYKDFSGWQNSSRQQELNKQQEAYWVNLFSDEIPVLDLPIDYPRPLVQSFDGNALDFGLSVEQSEALTNLALRTGSTLYMVVLAIYNILLFKISGQEDIVVGTPIAARRHVDLEKIIGMFVNTLAVRNYPEENKTFGEFLEEIKERTLEAFENQEYQFEELVERVAVNRDVSRNPLFDVLLSLPDLEARNRNIPGVEIAGAKVSPYDIENRTSKFDMTLTFVGGGKRLFFSLQYCTKLFKKETIERFIRYFKIIVFLVIREPGMEISQIEVMPEEEKRRILFDFNGTHHEYPGNKTIHQLFEEQAERTPDGTAAVGKEVIVGAQHAVPFYGNVHLTYKELDKKSNHLAHLLCEKGAKAGTIVGIMMERSIEMIIGIMGILKAGSAYLPIDGSYPQKRIEYMLTDSGAKILVNNRFLVEAGEKIFSTSQPLNLSTSQPTNLAYIIYTSGTTGNPKGVMVEHRHVVNLVFGLQRHVYSQYRDDLKVVLVSPYVFDASVKQIFASLLLGHTLCIVPEETRMDGEALRDYYRRYCIDISDGTPTHLRLLVEDNSGFHLKHFIIGGEELPQSLVEDFLNRLVDPKPKITNVYGPAECCVDSTWYEVSEKNVGEIHFIPIGKPMPNVQVYIVNRQDRLQPIGVPGELCIGGGGVGRGYLNQPELTGEKFIPVFYRSYRSYRTYSSQKIYKTGDLARWRGDGNIEFIGRMDRQVKIRGFRVELGEIESRLRKHSDIRDAVVMAREDEPGDKYLCAYVVGKGAFVPAKLREYLAGELPDYMIPVYMVSLERIPLTPNGKVDRSALPLPRLDFGEEYTAPGNKVEEKLVEIWSEVLKLEKDKVSINGNFFRLGGHSLKATVMTAKIRKELNVKVPLAEVFKRQTIRELLEYIREAKQTEYAAVEPVEEREYYALSSAQKRLYFLQQLDPAGTVYNMPLVMPLAGDIEKDKLESLLKRLLHRHDSLRTSFRRVNDEPVQEVHKTGEIDFAIEYYEVEEGTREIIERFIRPFDLSRAPLMRSGLIKVGDNSHTWIVDIHHIVSDGTSHTILTGDFISLYHGETPGPLKLQYKDFSEWQNHLFESGEIKVQEDYWLELYSDSKEIPRLQLPTDYKRPEVFTFSGAGYKFALKGEDAAGFKELGRKNGGTLYMNILAALNTLFHKYTGQTDIIIGSGIAGRRHADIQGIIGMFVNTLAMRNYPEGEKTYESFLQEVIRHSVAAFENQDVQFEELVDRLDVERETSRNPLFDISMVVQNFRPIGEGAPPGENPGQVEVRPSIDENLPAAEYRDTTAKFDMTFFVIEEGGDVYINIEYYTGIFKEETIRRLSRHLRNVINTVVNHPAVKLKDIEIVSEEEKERVLYEFNDTTEEYPGDKTIHELFEEQVERMPDGVAVIGQGVGAQGTVPVLMDHVSITYKELSEKSNRLAYYLIHEKNVLPGDRLGIWMSQSLYRPICILGILKAGAAYVPLDPGLPVERIKYIIDDAGIGIVLSEKKYVRDLNRLQWECVGFHSYLCVDSFDIDKEEEIEKNGLMDEKLWNHVGETAVDDITGGGWVSSYTGEPLSREEMDEYGDNIFKKLEPLLHPKMRVLEIGCASGISMYRIAPGVGLYYGTDLSSIIIDWNREKVEAEGYRNIELSCLAAHEIDKLEERNFDLVIMNSVIQCFHGHNYLRKVIRRAVEMLGETGYLFIGDVMDQEEKAALVRELTVFKQDNKGKTYAAKTDFSSELFVSRGFWTDLAAEWKEIERVEFTEKIYTIENELTKFRYDTLIGINKKSSVSKKNEIRLKYRDDLRNLSVYGPGVFHLKQSSGSLAYVIYTSGTTGQPRGVPIEHRSLVNLCYWHNRYYRITAADHAAMYAEFGFDASVWEFFPYLIKGASLYLIDDSFKLDIEKLNTYYQEKNITISFLPTQFCEQFMEKDNRSLRVLLTGGDKLRTVIKRNYRLYNNYGPTENTVVSTAYEVEAMLDNIPIGSPVDNSSIYILDKEGLVLQPPGVAGELCIAGDSLARGYLNNPELTVERFIKPSEQASLFPTPDSPTHLTIYRTGDLARWRWDGNIEFLGRIDQQVKVRGFRIEPGEIEIQLLKIEGINQAVVMARKDHLHQNYLCAYIVSKQGMNISPRDIKDALARALPAYMIPAYLVKIDNIPLTPNGKVDFRAFPAVESGLRKADNYAAPRNEEEEKIVEIWAEILGIEKEAIGVKDDFFELGGHSLKATILTAKIHKVFNVGIPLGEIFKNPTVEGICSLISVAEWAREQDGKMDVTAESEEVIL